ncbi:hypothetical protein KP509_14G026800 [Ceratopteris richardii]|uniref:Peroxisome biogenesis protein 22 n=1 Tax=Ceratopteris richardii TaxID=49495 RepID=A0A8T2TAD5_CERRI|nr:hypothetical protein KP509_14G026800 [Ceratopteris richardii]
MDEVSLKEQSLQFFRHVGASFFDRAAHLTSKMDDIMLSKSVGVVAGFTIAVICTWTYLKAAENRRRRLEKSENEQEQPSTSSNSGSSTAIAVHQTHTSHRGAKSAPTEIQAELTTAQIVRRQLNGGKKLTCKLLGIILKETSSEELQNHATVRPEVVDVLLEMVKACDLYLMTKVLDDENVLAALDAIGLFSVGGLDRNKVLFCSTEAGRSSFVRQLEPDWHVDTSVKTVSQLSRFIRNELYISPPGTSCVAPNVINAVSFESYFGGFNID